MNAQLENLIVLQAQDIDLQRMRAEVAEAPRRVKRAEDILSATQKTLAGVRTAIANEEKLRRAQEGEIASQRTKVDRLRRSLDGATSAAQISAFEREISFAQSTIERLEEEELASMERTETLEIQLRTINAEEMAAERRMGTERTEAARLVGERTQTIAGIEEQRKALRAELDPGILTSYDRLTKAKGTAVAEALGNATQGRCSACQMGVRPQRWQDLTGRDYADQIFTCESCGRMLFWDPRRDTPKAWEAGERLRNAQAATQAGSRGPA